MKRNSALIIDLVTPRRQSARIIPVVSPNPVADLFTHKYVGFTMWQNNSQHGFLKAGTKVHTEIIAGVDQETFSCVLVHYI